jgi:hypothetical protein
MVLCRCLSVWGCVEETLPGTTGGHRVDSIPCLVLRVNKVTQSRGKLKASQSRGRSTLPWCDTFFAHAFVDIVSCKYPALQNINCSCLVGSLRGSRGGREGCPALSERCYIMMSELYLFDPHLLGPRRRTASRLAFRHLKFFLSGWVRNSLCKTIVNFYIHVRVCSNFKHFGRGFRPIHSPISLGPLCHLVWFGLVWWAFLF